LQQDTPTLSKAPPSDDHAEGLTDARLVETVRAGDRDAYRVLVERYQRKLCRLAWRFVHDRQLAEDMAQEAFLRAYRRLADFDASRRFGPWLMRIAMNLCLDRVRYNRRRAQEIPADRAAAVADEADGVVESLSRSELQRQVRDAVDRLPLKYRTVLILRDLEGLSCSEVAAIVRRREGTVRWRLSRAREMFRCLWEQQQAALDKPRSRS